MTENAKKIGAWALFKRILGPLTCFSIAASLYFIAPKKPYGSVKEYWETAGHIVIAFATLWSLRNIWRYHWRWCQTCKKPLRLLAETEEDQYLNNAEEKEESLNSIDYDIWRCDACKTQFKLYWTNWFSWYSRCPECKYRTIEKSRTTLTAATQYSGGTDRVTETCQNCSFHRSYTVSTPRLKRNND